MHFQRHRGISEVLLCFQRDRGAGDIMSHSCPLVSITSWDHPSFFVVSMTDIKFLSGSGKSIARGVELQPSGEDDILKVYYIVIESSSLISRPRIALEEVCGYLRG